MAQRNWKLMAFAPVLAVGLIAGFACGGDDDDDNNTSPTTPAVATQPGGAATSPSGDSNGDVTEVPEGAPHVDQDGLAFIPANLTVPAGEKVYFTNSETALHTVDIDGKNESGPMRRGDIFVYTFEEAGSYKITCEYHPQMNATITVE